ncbi:hypothetical protein KFK09_010936 [Dendrobium nobile]|uniref:Uncharacterized protein n=1 Tax=Dendrobium nobile TaxID=94219 RepID=A0A8T3BEG8_DENNO|nr:hypothetical protein KFK09_010936 [Dendrobium nobile]
MTSEEELQLISDKQVPIDHRQRRVAGESERFRRTVMKENKSINCERVLKNSIMVLRAYMRCAGAFKVTGGVMGSAR